MKTAKDIRTDFLEFFKRQGHRIVPSGPVFPQDDPTLLFTNAGMNQFKDVFLGTGKRDYRRAADTQKCIRVSGKHNDLEEVGVDTYHHTFFEMLGNWSFGDYFKKDAIVWAWQLLTEEWGLPKDRLWVTVFGGDEKDGLPADDEAARIWAEETDIDPSRILKFGRKDNFWEMGETGPCGPCTEIHIDRGEEGCNRADGADRKIGVNAGNERFIELWNNVFIQFNRTEDGKLHPLPDQHVDTGMGFERIVSVLQGKRSNYDTDLFRPIFDRLEKLTGHKYGGSQSQKDVAFRVVADHARALTAAISDGALPGNDGRSYVLRRLLRRAARFGRQALGMDEPFIHGVIPVVAEILGDAFPEMRARADHVAHVVEAEERSFAVTLDKGLALFDSLAANMLSEGMTTIPGQAAFDLYATYGFPRDLVELMARERSLVVDSHGWDKAEERHRAASKSERKSYRVEPKQLEGLTATEPRWHGQHGEGEVTTSVRPLRLIDRRILILDRTPFYPESGGQVGDQGEITGGGFRFRVDDTQKMGDFVLHIGECLEGSPEALPKTVQASVDEARRERVMANHTATHLLHWALKKVLGDHANQQGSLVAPDRLRFDVTHPKAITPDELETIERLVNEKAQGASELKTTVEDLQDAKSRGVTALFGEKYDDHVRVVDIGGYSTELCGGTHCRSTGQIGAFAIISEGAVQAGVRRIEAVTRDGAIARMQEQRRLLREAAQLLKAPEGELAVRIELLQKQLKDLKKGGSQKTKADVSAKAQGLLAQARQVGGVWMMVSEVDGIDAKEIQILCDHLRNAGRPACGMVGMVQDDKVFLAAFASRDVAGRVHSGNLVKELAPLVGGGGGGRPEFAQAGGKDPAGLAEALKRAEEMLTRALEG